MRRLVGVAAAVIAVVVGTAGPAFAHSCANASRPQGSNAAAGGEGRWFYVPEAEAWVFDMPNEGSLLKNSRHCTEGVVQADKVYWNWTQDSAPHGIVTGCGVAP